MGSVGQECAIPFLQSVGAKWAKHLECGDESRRSRDELAAFAWQGKKLYGRHQTHRARTDFAEVLSQRRIQRGGKRELRGHPASPRLRIPLAKAARAPLRGLSPHSKGCRVFEPLEERSSLKSISSHAQCLAFFPRRRDNVPAVRQLIGRGRGQGPKQWPAIWQAALPPYDL
jgi:hypothetical protein